MGSKVVKFEVVAFAAARVIGKSVTVKEPTTLDDPTSTDLLESMSKDGHNDFLLSQPNRVSQSRDTVGWMGDYIPGGPSYTYLAGVLFKPGTAVPSGYEYRDMESCQMAVAWIQGCEGDEGGDLYANASGNLGKARDEHGYVYDGSHGLFEMEYYSEESSKAVKEGKPPVLRFYSPCKKA